MQGGKCPRAGPGLWAGVQKAPWLIGHGLTRKDMPLTAWQRIWWWPHLWPEQAHILSMNARCRWKEAKEWSSGWDSVLPLQRAQVRFVVWAQTKKKKKKKYKTILYKKTQNKEKLINAILKAFFFSFLQIRKRLWFFHFLWQCSFYKLKILGHGLQMNPKDEG